MIGVGTIIVAAASICLIGRANGAEYLGKSLGKLSELHHGVSGEVYAVDGRTLHIKDFTYDGEGPGAYFYASTYKAADSKGFRLRDENNNGAVIRRYRKEGITLTLPEGKTLSNIKIFYVWCEDYDVSFGDVKIPRNFDFPRPQKIDALKGVHSISSDNVVIVDAQTLLIPNLYFDGEAPDAKFWVGRGSKPSPQGIRVPDENGKELPLRRYDGKTVVLTLPGDLTVFDIGHFGIWCEEFTVDFGHIPIPQNLNIPPSLKMLGVSPQSKLNCEVLKDKLAFEVRWAIAGESIVIQLVAKLDDRQYMSFGVSPEESKSVMVGGDVVVAWVDKNTLKGYAEDYYLQDKSQCSGPTGSCPDTRFRENTNNVRLLNAAMVNGYSIITYQRPLKASDEYDLPIHSNKSQAIIWAIGPLNQRNEVSFHSSYLKGDSFIDFGRPAKWNCPTPESDQPAPSQPKDVVVEQESVEEEEPPSTTTAPRRTGGERRRAGGRPRRPAPVDIAEEAQATKKEPTRTKSTNRVSQRGVSSQSQKKVTPWEIPPIECYEPDDGVFYAQMGPTGGKRGYPAITGHVGWGISWYINGLLIPVVNVVRGKTYTFVVEGGHDSEVAAKYHPFYITDDPVGGYIYKTPEERKNITIFAGASQAKDGSVVPTGTGRLCNWTPSGDKEADDFDSFGAYQRTLQLKCDQGEPGVIQWTPTDNTPDTVYYQCFSHRHLGWKINVLDSCDEEGSASELKPVAIIAPDDVLNAFHDQSDVGIESGASAIQERRVMPNKLHLDELKTDKSQTTVSENATPLDVTRAFIMSLKRPNRPIYHTNAQSTKTLTTKRHVLAEPHLPSHPEYTKMTVKNVQISPLQASTEREPILSSNHASLFELPPDTDTDLEGGVEIDAEGQTGVINIKGEKKFEKIKRKSKPLKFPKKPKPTIHTRSLIDMNVEPEMAAGDKIESYYLPPPGHSEKPQYSPSKQPSNIDFDAPTTRGSSPTQIASSPPDIVVTYDGKKVSGASLSAKPFEKSSLLQQRGSKAAEFIKARPQSVPFKGELPPLNPDVLFDTKHLQKASRVGVLSRDLDTPLPPPSGSTKLTRVKI